MAMKTDYMLRLAARIGAALAKMLQQALESDQATTDASVKETLLPALRVEYGLVETLDVNTLVPLLGPPEVARTVALAQVVRGRSAELGGRRREARAQYLRAAELYRAVGPGDGGDHQKALKHVVEWLRATVD